MTTVVNAVAVRDRTVSVFIVESNPLLRLGLRTAMNATVGIRCIGEAGTAAALTELVRRRRPDILLVEARLLAAAPAEPLSHRILEGLAGAALLYGGRVDDLIAISPSVGPLGYVDKSGTPDGLAESILKLQETAIAGGRAEATWRRQLMIRTDVVDVGITRRELEVLGLYADGLTNKQIARHLAVSETTIRFHSSNILRKLSAATRSQAVFKAVRTGMIRA
jgi:DNA-binding NarL/FixJ family response regulator